MFGTFKKLFGGEEKEEKIIAAPVNGTAIPMSQVADPTFSQEILGKGGVAYLAHGNGCSADRRCDYLLFLFFSPE